MNMANLDAIIGFASDHQFNLTGSLSNEDVQRIAKEWLPEIRFHESDYFHPISLEDLLNKAPEVFQSLSESEREALRITLKVLGNDGNPVDERFDPPMLRVFDQSITDEDPETGDTTHTTTFRVVNDGVDMLTALEDPQVNDNAVITNGSSYGRARKVFGSTSNVDGVDTNIRIPRWEPIKVIAEFKMLLETLQYELLVERDADYPHDQDGLRGGYNIVNNFFAVRDSEEETPFPRSLKTSILVDLIEEFQNGDSNALQNAKNKIPQGWFFVESVWNTVRDYAFLEFYFVYAYNDYDKYGTWPFENEHEGDIEGCCVVFERAKLEDEAEKDIPDFTLTKPRFIITSVHEEWQGGDRFKELDPAHARDDLKVWVAVGSHATYLSAGTHDILDFGDSFSLPFKDGISTNIILALTLGVSGMIVLGLIFAIAEHFVDSEDETSDGGTFTGPPDDINLEDPDIGPRFFETEIITTPLSGEPPNSHIYTEGNRDALAVRSFTGRWGAHNNRIDHSGPFDNKTGRYFRKFIRNVKTGSGID